MIAVVTCKKGQSSTSQKRIDDDDEKNEEYENVVYKQHLNIYRIKSRVSGLFPLSSLRDYLYPSGERKEEERKKKSRETRSGLLRRWKTNFPFHFTIEVYIYIYITSELFFRMSSSSLLSNGYKETHAQNRYDELIGRWMGLVFSDRSVITIN